MNHETTFHPHRPRLLALAYRLLGSRADAEDVVQDAWLRWAGANRADIIDPEAWLVTATTRLGLDRLRALKRQRLDYFGPWLPEPLHIAIDLPQPPDPAQVHALAEDVSLAFLSLLELLAPEERAAFLLKDVFDHDYAQVAELVGHSEANCRQMVHRARKRLQDGRPRFTADAAQHRRLLQRFIDASQRGDSDAIQALLHANAQQISDGGGVVTAAIRPLMGAERIGRLYGAIARRGAALPAQLGWVNGEPAILRFNGEQLESITTIVIEDGRIRTLLSVLNPGKLGAFVTARDAGASL